MTCQFLIHLCLLMRPGLVSSYPEVYDEQVTACSTNGLNAPDVFGAVIQSINATEVSDFEEIPGLDICLFTIITTHTGAGDRVTSWIGLPLTSWNGMFQGVGGSGAVAGELGDLTIPLLGGFAGGATDAGVGESGNFLSWALRSPGNVNQDLLLDFSHRALHEMTVIGKLLAFHFYGQPVKHSYWNGCSQGGRQGLALAQYYPEDYDGIVANAPGIQWSDFTFAQEWPYTVQIEEGHTLSPCEQTAIQNAVIDACDSQDGLKDGIVSAPAICNFDANQLVGEHITCGGSAHTLTQTMADVVNKIWQGPRTTQNEFLWYGLIKGANFSATSPNQHGTAPIPYNISDDWIRGFVGKDINFDTSMVNYTVFPDLLHQSRIQYDSIIGTTSADLSAFKSRGGKIITWQGLADDYISPQGTMQYFHRIQTLDPTVQSFYRQFYSPGVGHCGGGIGVIPVDPIAQIRQWVENGTAPRTLIASSLYPANASSSYRVNATTMRYLNLCPYPEVQAYVSGDPNKARSWACVPDTNGWIRFG